MSELLRSYDYNMHHSLWRVKFSLGGYRNALRKHLVDVEGELLLNRTLRIVAGYEPARTIVVINEADLDIYASTLAYKPEFHLVAPYGTEHTEAYKYLSSKCVWNSTGKTIVLLGDVWFSEEALNKIFEYSADSWTAFGRAGSSRFTGCPHGELFALSFTSCAEHERNLIKLDSMYRDGTCTRSASGWALYQLMIGENPNTHAVGSCFVEINDFTEDFDSSSDYDLWVSGRSFQRSLEFNYDSWAFGRSLHLSWTFAR